jgi:hypothetical protein
MVSPPWALSESRSISTNIGIRPRHSRGVTIGLIGVYSFEDHSGPPRDKPTIGLASEDHLGPHWPGGLTSDGQIGPRKDPLAPTGQTGSQEETIPCSHSFRKQRFHPGTTEHQESKHVNFKSARGFTFLSTTMTRTTAPLDSEGANETEAGVEEETFESAGEELHLALLGLVGYSSLPRYSAALPLHHRSLPNKGGFATRLGGERGYPVTHTISTPKGFDKRYQDNLTT